MDESGADLAAQIEVPLDPSAAFGAFLEDLIPDLARLGLRFDPVPDGRVLQAGREVGRILEWDPGKVVRLEWRSADWKPETVTQLDLRFDPIPGGTRISVVYRG